MSGEKDREEGGTPKWRTEEGDPHGRLDTARTFRDEQ